MRYDYECENCKARWEETQFLNDRDLPLSKPCPECSATGSVRRAIFFAAKIAYGGAKSNLSRAGSGWNDLLTGIKKASAKNNTITTR